MTHPTSRCAPASARRPHDDATARAVALVSLQDAMRRTSAVYADLARRGCVVLSAHVVPDKPLVVVAPPPPSSGLTGALRRRDRYRSYLTTLVDGVRVEWRVPCGGAS